MLVPHQHSPGHPASSNLIPHLPRPPCLKNKRQEVVVTYHGVGLTVWSHADAERSLAIRRTLETGCARKESARLLGWKPCALQILQGLLSPLEILPGEAEVSGALVGY
jgi:hypothetical protein